MKLSYIQSRDLSDENLQRRLITIGVVAAAIVLGIILLVLQVTKSTSATSAKWSKEYATAVSAILADNSTATKDNDGSHLAQLETDCRRMAADVTSAKKLQPIPNVGAETHKNNMLTYFGLSAADCINGAHDAQTGAAGSDVTIIRRATTEFNSSASYLTQAKTEMDAFNRAL